ncbi:hypothetical protein ACJ72_01098 [Emergomyces africanus]|uniref:Uncharacterized protein n=1 Tax=Emergomyces africanus TaxID=1955775 RepID=A0A1B7P6C2_9EURO|nr:hypothetical protein ACJ72_01098 [Emergomyces africanus]
MPVATARPRRASLWSDYDRSTSSNDSFSSGRSSAGYSGTSGSELDEDVLHLFRKPSSSRSRLGALTISTDLSTLAKRYAPASECQSEPLLSPIYKTIYPISAKDVNTCLSPVYKTIYPRTDDKDGNATSPIYKTIYPRSTSRHSSVPKSDDKDGNARSPIYKMIYPRSARRHSSVPKSPSHETPRSKKDDNYEYKDFAKYRGSSPSVRFKDGQHDKVTCAKGHTTRLPESQKASGRHGRRKCSECELQEEIKACRVKYQPDIQRRHCSTGQKRASDGSVEFGQNIREFNLTSAFLSAFNFKPSLNGKYWGRYTRLDQPKNRSYFYTG